MRSTNFKKLLILIPILSMTIYSQYFESKLYGAVILPIGAELGFIGETDIPKTDMLKVITKGSLTWATVLGNSEKTKSVLIGGFQPGLRLNY